MPLNYKAPDSKSDTMKKTIKTGSPTTEPITFLSLPSELRQQILLDTFTPQSPSSSDPNYTRSELYAWASTLRSVDVDLRDDVNHVEKQGEEESDNLEKQAGTWKQTRRDVDEALKDVVWWMPSRYV